MNIKLIQGDTIKETYSFPLLKADDVTLYFTCEEQGLTKKLEYNDEDKVWELNIPSEDTMLFGCSKMTYDITCVNIDGTVDTLIYNAVIETKPKLNKLQINK